MNCRKSVVAVWLIIVFFCLSTLEAKTKKKEEEAESEKAIQALLVTGGSSHDYKVRKEIITRGIRERVSQKIEWMVRLQGEGESDAKIPLFESSAWAEGYDIVVHDYCFPRVRDADYVDRILVPHLAGTPAVLIHGTMHSFRTGDSRWFDFCGVTSHRHDENYPLTIIPKTPLGSIWGDLDSWMTPAGQLYLIDEVAENAKVLGTSLARAGGEKHAVVWQHHYGPAAARVFGMTPGNDLTTLVQPEYLDVLARGFLWALKKTGKDAFRPVVPESSLSGFVLPIPPPDLPGVGARALGFSSASIAMPGETVASSSPDGLLAVDRESATSWLPEKAGPVVWQGEISHQSEVAALVIVWENPPEQYALSTSMDGLAWNSVGGSILKGSSLTALHEFPERPVKWIRVDLLQSGGSEPSGIRELGAYASAADIPAAFRGDGLSSELSELKGDAPLSLNDDRVGDDFRLHPDWSLNAISELAPATVVKSITTKATDSAFLMVSSGLRKDAAFKVLHCQKTGEGVEVTTFLDGLAPSSVIGWDGEWLFVFDGSNLTQYRGTGDDSVADERHSLGALFLDDLSDQDVPVNRVFHEMVVAPDGGIYVSFSQDVKSEAYCRAGKVLALPQHGILRFTREADDPELIVSSGSKINSFAVGNQTIRLVSSLPFEGVFELPPLAAGLSNLASLSDLIPDALARGGHEQSWIERVGSDISEVARDKGALNRATIASIPGILYFSFDGLNNGWFVRRAESEGRLQLGVISQGGVIAPIDLNRVSTADLTDLLGKGTDRQMEAVFLELLRRKRIPLEDLETVFNATDRSINERGLALRLLVEGDKSEALSRLIKCSYSEVPELRRLAFKLLGRVSGTTNHEVFSRIGEETNPLVTTAILSGIFRSGSNTAALNKLVLKLAATPEPQVADAALAFLARRDATSVCFEALDDPDQTNLWAAAFKVLSQSHRRTVAEGLGDRLARTSDPKFRTLCLSSLCRLYASPSGGTWEASGFIGSLLRASLSDRRVNKLSLLDQMIAHEIPFPLAPLINSASEDLRLEAFIVDRLMKAEVSSEITPWLLEITKSESRDVILKRKALIALAGVEQGETFLSLFDAVVNALSEEPWVGDNRGLLEERWRENPVRSIVADSLIKKTSSKAPLESQLAWEPLLLMRDDIKGGGSNVQAVVERIDEVLFTKQEGIRQMLLAMKRVSSFELPRALAVISSGDNEALKQFVKENAISDAALKNWSPSYDDSNREVFLAEAGTHVGDPVAGYKWFQRAGCNACHNIHGEGPSLGPDFSFQTTAFDLAALFVAVTNPATKVSESSVLHTFEMRDGNRVIGADVSRESEQIHLIDTAGNRVSFPESNVHRDWVQGESLMPQMAAGTMTSRDLADLKAFLDSLVVPGLNVVDAN